jgi:protein-tyrosine phosphatase
MENLQCNSDKINDNSEPENFELTKSTVKSIYSLFYFHNLRPLKDKLYDALWNLQLFKTPRHVARSHDITSRVDEIIRSTTAQITKKIYLGSSWNAANYRELKNNRIGSILNVTSEIGNYYTDDFIYLQVPIRDINKSSILENLNTCYQFIEEQSKKHNILVHCFAGCSRSAAVVTYYLMRKMKLPFYTAYEIVKRKREAVCMNITYVRELDNLSFTEK